MFILLYNYYYYKKIITDDTSFDSTFLYLLVFFISIFSKFDLILNYFLNDERIILSTSTFVYNLLSSSLIYYNISKYQWYYTNNLINNYQYHKFGIFDKVIYIMELAHYLYDVKKLFFKKKTSKDDSQMLFHHITTIILLLGSYHLNLLRIGMYTMLLHNVNDIFLHGSKLFFYNNFNDTFTTSIFVLFLIIWIYTRLYLFTSVILYQTYYFETENNLMITLKYVLSCILVLNLYWTNLIYLVLKNKIDNGKVNDIREY